VGFFSSNWINTYIIFLRVYLCTHELHQQIYIKKLIYNKYIFLQEKKQDQPLGLPISGADAQWANRSRGGEHFPPRGPRPLNSPHVFPPS